MRLGRYDETAIIPERKVLTEKVTNNFFSYPWSLQIILIEFFVKTTYFGVIRGTNILLNKNMMRA